MTSAPPPPAIPSSTDRAGVPRGVPAAGLSRRGMLGLGLAAGAAALVGCSAATSASGAASAGASGTASGAAGSTVGATSLKAGSYDATFTSTQPGPGGGGGTQTLRGAYLVDGVAATIDGGSFASSTADQNVFLVVNGGSLTVTGATITKTGDSSNEEACNFYGLNSAVLVVGAGSTATLKNCTVTTDATGANALFAAGSGALDASGVTIATTKDSSRGLDATYAGTITATGLKVTTQGAHCACLATDRGNGTITVATSTLSAAGDCSPLIYSTGNISVSDSTGTATGAQTMVIEGKNQIALTGCTFTTKGTEGMMIYQSMSGDAADSDATTSASSMTIKDSTITSTADKPMIYVTNTSCKVAITNSKLTHPSGTPLLSLAEDRWGTAGSNGGKAAVAIAGSTLTGALSAGSSSSATVALASRSRLTGATSGAVTVTTDASSTWTK